MSIEDIKIADRHVDTNKENSEIVKSNNNRDVVSNEDKSDKDTNSAEDNKSIGLVE